MRSTCDPEYRYVLSRLLVPLPVVRPRRVLFCALNPSTATETRDDPTVRRMTGFAWRFDATEMRLVNLFAARATRPDRLWKLDDPVGPLNDSHIEREAEAADIAIAAWGATAKARRRAGVVLEIMRRYGPVYRLGGTTKEGCPQHPLYLPAEVELEVHATGRVLTSGSPGHPVAEPSACLRSQASPGPRRVSKIRRPRRRSGGATRIPGAKGRPPTREEGSSDGPRRGRT